MEATPLGRADQTEVTPPERDGGTVAMLWRCFSVFRKQRPRNPRRSEEFIHNKGTKTHELLTTHRSTGRSPQQRRVGRTGTWRTTEGEIEIP
ncbi:hypothetical protein NL676_034781 [Syzygium grande]|nr:hypothetical protein NL676_034781 [Syzygium grande]